MYVAEAGKTRLGNVPHADTTLVLQPRKTREDTDDETKEAPLRIPGSFRFENHEGAVCGAGAGIVDPRSAVGFMTGDAASYDETDPALYPPSIYTFDLMNLTVNHLHKGN